MIITGISGIFREAGRRQQDNSVGKAGSQVDVVDGRENSEIFVMSGVAEQLHKVRFINIVQVCSRLV